MATRVMITALFVALSALTGCINSRAQPTAAARAAAHLPPASVVYVTGSRIGVPVTHPKNVNPADTAAPQQSVSAEEMELSGQTDAASALRLMVPALAPVTK